MKSKVKTKKEFDKYEYYNQAVQSTETDVVFLRGVYRELRKQEPVILREDFCAAFALSCDWVKLGKNLQAVSVDLDPEPIEYGREHYIPKLNSDQQSRLKILQGNVLDPKIPAADIVAAMNFSYFIF